MLLRMPAHDLTEEETRLQLIDPALERAGWHFQSIDREEWTGRVTVDDWWERGRADYVLKMNVDGEFRRVAVVEAKSLSHSAAHGAGQAAQYARAIRVPFAYSTNGSEFVEIDMETGEVSLERSLSDFPTPRDLSQRHPRYQGDVDPSPGAVDDEGEVLVEDAKSNELPELPSASIEHDCRSIQGTPLGAGRKEQAKRRVAEIRKRVRVDAQTKRQELGLPLWGLPERSGDRCTWCDAITKPGTLFCQSCWTFRLEDRCRWVTASRSERLATQFFDYLLFCITLGIGWVLWMAVLDWKRKRVNSQSPALAISGLHLAFYHDRARVFSSGTLALWSLWYHLLMFLIAGLLAAFVHPGLFAAPFLVDAIPILGTNRQMLRDRWLGIVVVKAKGSESKERGGSQDD